MKLCTSVRFCNADCKKFLHNFVEYIQITKDGLTLLHECYIIISLTGYFLIRIFTSMHKAAARL